MTSLSPTKMRRPSSSLSQQENGIKNTLTSTPQMATTTWTEQTKSSWLDWEQDTTGRMLIIMLPTVTSRLARRITVLVTQPQWLASTCSKTAHSLMLSGGSLSLWQPQWLAITCSKTAHSLMLSGGWLSLWHSPQWLAISCSNTAHSMMLSGGWLSLWHSPSDWPAPAPRLPTLWCCQGDRCPCDTAPMTGRHLLQDCPFHDVVGRMAVLVTQPPVTSHLLLQYCPFHDVVRRETWPKDSSLRDKLFGDTQTLRGTAADGRLYLAFKKDDEQSHTYSLLVDCLTSQQHASESQGRICSDNCTWCHTEIEVVDQTFHLTQSQYTDTGPTSPSTDPIRPGAW